MMLLTDNSTEQQSFPVRWSFLNRLKHFAVFGYLPIIRAGLVDGLNPGSLMGLLLFVVYLVILLESGQPFLWRGLVFIWAVGFTSVLIQMGFFNLLMAKQGFAIFIDGSYFLISVLAVAASVILLYDWKKFRKNNSRDQLRIKFNFLDRAVPFPRLTDRAMRFRSGVVGIVAAYFSGILVAFLETAWPPDVGVVYILYELTLPEGWKSVVVLFFIYAVVFVLPLAAILFILYKTISSSSNLMKIRENFSKLQIIAAAILMGYGIAFLMEFIL